MILCCPVKKMVAVGFLKPQIECLRQRVPMHQLYDLQHSSPVFLLSVSFHDHSSACLGHSDLLTPTLPVSFLDCDTVRLHHSVSLWASLVLFVHCEAAPILCFVLTKSSQSTMPFFCLRLDINVSRISQTVLTIFSCFLVTVQIHCYAVWLRCYQISWLWQRSSQLLVLVCDVLQKASLECQLFFRASKSQS